MALLGLTIVASALRSGILFLPAVPIATFGTIAWYAVHGQRSVEGTETER